MNKLNEYKWPETDEALDKINFDIEPFMRIYWIYDNQLEAQEDIWCADIKSEYTIHYPNSGIVIPKEDATANGYLDIDECNVIVDEYPISKEYCRYSYITLSELLDADYVVRVSTERFVNKG